MATSAARTAVTHCNNRTRDKIKTSHKDGLHVVYRETETLTPYAKNSRTHTDEQIAQVAASIREFGFTNPILIDEQGGNTEAFYAKEGTLPKSEMLARMHHDVSRVVWKFSRWHHHVDYTSFRRNKLIRRTNVEVPEGVDDYGMSLRRIK